MASEGSALNRFRGKQGKSAGRFLDRPRLIWPQKALLSTDLGENKGSLQVGSWIDPD